VKSKYRYKSSLADNMQMFLRLKKMSGFKYYKQAKLMESFDSYCMEKGFLGKALTRKLARGFLYGFYYDREQRRYEKALLLNDFGKFLCQNGHKSYICPKIPVPVQTASGPYIYSEDELGRLFKAIDRYPTHPLTNRHLVDPLMFRMIYGCGLRVSEAINLKLKDIDTKEGTITILNSKNGKDRLVPIADSLTKRCRDYLRTVHIFGRSETYFFKSSSGLRLDRNTAYHRFRDYLWSAGIPHSGHGPTIQDFRHTYCVHRLKKWVLEGRDLNSLFPYLSAYLGHADFRGTQYYLRLTADLYPHIIAKTEAALGYIIPERSTDYENK
jgi:integrase/recombinase XerD